MIYELRYYHIVQGKLDEWIKLMDERIIPFQRIKGMMVVGSFAATDREDLYIWIRRYESEEHRKKVYDEVYGSDYWKKEIKPIVNDLLLREQSEVIMLEPTAGSFLQ